MYLPKQDIYELLDGYLPGGVIQNSDNVFTTLPTITFNVAENAVSLDLSNQITYQDISITIDFWAAGSKVASTMLSDVEQLMRSAGYKLAFSTDVPNPDPAVWHINSRFTTRQGG
ncbi:MAG: hypothetical protein FWD45_00250 [Coriobacteriia bacterium]|nr:hypothetical protein [Coriobacteriia bacterium]